MFVENCKAAILALLACNSLGERVGLTVASLVILFFGVWVLRRARAGKIRATRLFGFWQTGEDAKFWTTVCAAVVILLGAVVLTATLLGLDC